jgi:hypothetical protein
VPPAGPGVFAAVCRDPCQPETRLDPPGLGRPHEHRGGQGGGPGGRPSYPGRKARIRAEAHGARQALDVIRAQPTVVGKYYVLGGVPFCNFGEAKTKLDRASGVSGWTLHDLRRTARSLMSRAGVRPDIAERVLGHTVGSAVQQTYDRHSYTEEKAQALAALALLVERILVGPTHNVVPLREAAQS